MRILLLMKKEAVGSLSDLNAKEVTESTQMLDGELITQPESNLLKKGCGGGRYDDVVDIEQQVSSRVAMVIDEQRGIRASDTKAQCLKRTGDTLVSGARCLLEAVERRRQQAHMARMRGVDETSGLLTVNLLRKVTMKKGVGNDVHLMNWPAARDRQLKNSADRAQFDNQCKRLGEVNSSMLPKTTDHPTSLIKLESAIRAGLVTKDPLAADDVGAGGGTNVQVRFCCRASNSSCITAS
ncbi:uncharacterized protein [Aegilops tauschii subsp. strangulata]|uniref:uncharacterized protein n=1 Tax=Aegilops tauschii subsp. strangulata TaxID=200361 RepID=UPI001E1CA105|nr:uncharacterized protein LOC123496895 [Aegilops tauschii subsp. strangulata]